MTDETQAPTPSDQSLDDILAEYIAREEAGRPADRQAFLVLYPQYAADLREFFANRDQMQRLAAPIRDPESQSLRPSRSMTKVRYFGDYELLEEIAAGGMGIVYKARQVSLNRIVAVKMILKGKLASDEDVKRFRAEAEAAANLHHPAIVAIYEVGLHEGQHYFSMEFVDGQSLAELSRDQPLSARRAAEYIRDAAEAVHYAHQQGTLHRDLKPSNILIDRQGRVRITDFGLARRIGGDSDLTLTGQILGTPSYMSPEQATGKRSLVAAASDIYSLGAVLYELPTGRPPFRGESPAETLRQVESLDAISPRLLNPAIPRDLETICLKCLEKEPHKRYGTAELLADDLDRYLRGEPIVARPIRAWQRGIKWLRRHPTAAGFVIMSLVALLALVGVLVGQSYNARLKTLNGELATAKQSLETRNEQLSTANNALETAKGKLETSNKELGEASGKLENALDAVIAERARARRYLYAARMALVQRAEHENQPGRVVQLLRSVIPESPQEEDLRDFEWYFLWRKFQGEELRLSGHSGPVIAVAISPDQKWIASGSIDRTVRIWSAATGKEVIVLSGHGDRVHEVTFALDSQQLLTASDDNFFRVWDFQSGREIARVDAASLISGSRNHNEFWEPFGGEKQSKLWVTANTTICSAYNSDRSQLVEGKTVYGNASFTATVRVLRTDGDASIASIDVPAAVTQVAFSRDGKLIAAAALDQNVRVWNAENGALVCTLHSPDGVRSVAFSPDRSQIVAGTENRLVILWSLPTRVEHTFLPGKNDWATCVSFGEHGRLLAAVCGGRALVWDVLSGQQVASLLASRYRRVVMSPIHDWIAGAPPSELIDVRTRSVVRALHDGGSVMNTSGGPLGYAISPDESLIAEASGGRATLVHDVATGKLVETIEMPDWASSAAFSPNSKLLAAGSGYFAQGTEKRGAILVRELATRQTLFQEQLPLDVWSLAFSPDGRMLAAAMGVCEDAEADLGRIRIWSTANWKTLYDLRGHRGCVWSLSFNPSGSRLASAGGGRFRQSSGKALSRPGEVKFWDTVTGEEVFTTSADSGPIYGVAFSPDGNRLAIAHGSGAVKTWDGTPLAFSPSYRPLPEGF